MDDFPEGDFTLADDTLLEGCPYEDDCICAPDFTTDDYVRVTELYYNGVGMQYKDYAQSEKNLEYDICNIWCSKPLSILQDYCDTIKLYIFWPLLFQHQHSSIISRLHPCVEATRSRAAEISLKKLQHLELMEDIVDLAKKVAKILAMEEALNWIKYTGDVAILPKLGSVDSCWPMLSIFFTEYKYHITKVVTENCNLLEEFRRNSCMQCVKQGELMKMRGNEEFSKQRFDIAVIFYTRAIEYRPENHLLYGNRALCFLRMGQFRNALSDGKRAIVLKNTWPKGHYRYCDALSMLGEYDWALQANIKAQKLCKNDPEGIKDLIQQHVKLQKQIEDLQGRTSSKNPIKAFYESRAYTPRNPSTPAFRTSLNFVETDRGFRKTKYRMADGGNHNLQVADEALKGDDCDCHPEFLPPPSQPPKHKGKQKSRNNESQKPSYTAQVTLPDLKNILEKQFSKSSRAAHQDFANIMKMLRSLIQDGYTALLEQRCRSAAQAFTELLNGLDPQKIRQLNLAMINYVLVVYGLAVSLLGIGRPEELSEAENQFKRIIEHYPNEGLDCLAYCGIGKVYLKKNRFLEALNHFEKAKTLVYRLPGVLTWPTSNVIIEESKPEKVKMMLEKFVEECKFPPVPDAVCCYQKCRGYSKIQIYLTDPDFKGFIRISCCQYCKVEFHMNCWKKLKTTTFNDKIDKDFLQGICLTPDCEGIISKIIIFSSGGQVKCEFEHKVIKEKAPSKPVLKQKCSSLEKLRLKEDKKLKRKIQKQEAKKLAQERMEEDLRESNPPKNEEPEETVDSGQSCQFLDDRILQCIKQNSDKIKSGILNTSTLLKELLSWKVLSTEDYTTCFSSKNFLREAVDYVIRHLVQEKNRVKTRIFLHVLSELKEVDPKLAPWIQRLNSFGLDATGPFFTRYGASLKELDFSVMTFLWNEKYGHKLGSIEGKQLDYFCEPASMKEARCLIWLLEEHRDKFPALHNALDEFFDIMDSRCTVLRKQDSDEVPFGCIKVKNKGKKKKPKDSKPMLVGSGPTSVTASTETVTPEDHKRSSDSAGPFAVPDHLRQDVEEFEALYDQHSSEYVVRNKKLWDINPKQKCSTLYDYFSQLLEEHGPLDLNDKVFSEEDEFFPEETRQMLEKAGGLKSFLLGCPRFVVIDNCIALRKVASRLKKKRKKKNIKTKVEEISKTGEYLRVKLPLNPAAREFKPDVKSAPVCEDVKSAPGPAESPRPAPEDLKPQLDSDSSCGSASEDSRLDVASSDSPPPLSEDVHRRPASSPSPTPAPEDAKPTYWTQSHVVTGFCTYLPFQGFDITQSRPAYINVVPNLSQFAGIYTPLASISSEYAMQRSMPVVPSFVTSDRADKNATAYFESHNLNTGSDCGDQIASDMQILEDSLGVSVQSQGSPSDLDTALSEPDRNSRRGGSPDSQCEESLESTSKATDTPPSAVLGIQVSRSVVHQEVNTEPYVPFETQQGDLSQTEKEYCVLRDQLKAAVENYEQITLRSSEETRDLEEKLKRNVEENEISKTELDWFLQDLDREVKKWQQEKKEIQERLKALKKKIKKVTSEMPAQKIDDLDKEFGSYLDQSPEISALTSEKAAVEERIRRGTELCEESRQRAASAELSVLENWKEREVCKLQSVVSQAETYLKNLKLMSSDSASYPDMECDTLSWELCLSNVREEIESTKSQFEDQIKAIKNGSRLSELSSVQISELTFPDGTTIHPQLPSESSGHEDHGPMTSAAVHKDSPTEPTGGCPEEVPDLSLGSPIHQPEVAQQSEVKMASPLSPSEQSPEADEKRPGQAARSSQSPKKPFNSVIEHLLVVFPSYTSSELAGFVKKVRNKSKSSLSGLSVEGIVERVTEHILEEQRKKAQAAAAVAKAPQSAAPLAVGGPSSKTKGQKRDDVSVNPAPDANSCELCHEVFKSKNMRVLKCGHKFHKGCFKQWLKGQSTCPTCGCGDLLSQE
nr:E3 ubiquitin-protein ligase TTC3 isoform X8 [Peromyscus maniculatus bairdii]